MVSGVAIRLTGAGRMAGKPRWAIPLIAALAIVVFFIFVAGSASAAKISGTVTDTNGIRVVGATVTIYQNGSEYVHQNNPGLTDITGYYEFSGLPDGAYSIQADKEGFFSSSDSALIAGTDVQKNLKIPGYDSKAATPTMQAYVTITPTPAPPTPTPTAKPSPTKVPLPTPAPTPGFGLPLALISLSAVVAIRRFK
jgi:hypothetical protein